MTTTWAEYKHEYFFLYEIRGWCIRDRRRTWPRGTIEMRSQHSTFALSYRLNRWDVIATPTSVVALRHCPWWHNSIPTRLGPTVSLSTAPSMSDWRIDWCPLLTATRAASWTSWANFAPVQPNNYIHGLRCGNADTAKAPERNAYQAGSVHRWINQQSQTFSLCLHEFSEYPISL